MLWPPSGRRRLFTHKKQFISYAGRHSNHSASDGGSGMKMGKMKLSFSSGHIEVQGIEWVHDRADAVLLLSFKIINYIPVQLCAVCYAVCTFTSFISINEPKVNIFRCHNFIFRSAHKPNSFTFSFRFLPLLSFDVFAHSWCFCVHVWVVGRRTDFDMYEYYGFFVLTLYCSCLQCVALNTAREREIIVRRW